MEVEIVPEKFEFRKMHCGNAVDLQSYIGEVLGQNPQCELHIGCDSKNYSRYTVYVTTIVFRFPFNGAHVLYRKEKVQKIEDLWSKLWGETMRSVELANHLRQHFGIKIKQIDLDFNSDPTHLSHRLLASSEGYVKSLGFIPRAKPDLLMAVWAANALCQ